MSDAIFLVGFGLCFALTTVACLIRWKRRHLNLVLLALFCWPLALVISLVCELWFDSHRIYAYRDDFTQNDN
ncbi:MAG: hypothetical protein JO308_03095 [Verrucomicrobia bacterium]|nr:hypothetical protein [Verrucomicrobiota bacterium]